LHSVIEGATPEAIQFVTLVDGMVQSISNVYIAIRTNLGEDALQEFLATNQMPVKGCMEAIDPTSITVLDDTSAAAREVGGKLVQLSNTSQGWKVSFGKTSDPETAMMFSMMTPMFTSIIEMTNNITAKINNGELTTVEEINTEGEKGLLENLSPF
jgi:hypothetical protein